MLKVTVLQYTQKLEELEGELVDLEKQIPELVSKQTNVNLSLQVEELSRGILADGDDTGRFDEEFEEAIQDRVNTGKKLLSIGSLSTPSFR